MRAPERLAIARPWRMIVRHLDPLAVRNINENKIRTDLSAESVQFPYAYLISAVISLFREIISLFGRNNSLLFSVGNSPEIPCYISTLPDVFWPQIGENRENSLYFPCLTGKSAETGSLRTACTASQSGDFATAAMAALNIPIFQWVTP
jgi:hypothetical protein